MFRKRHIAAAIGLVALQIASVQASELLVSPSRALASAQSDPAYAALARDPSTSGIQVVGVDAALVNDYADSIGMTVDLGVPVALSATRSNSYRNPDGTLVWEGVIENTTDRNRGGMDEIAGDPMNAVTLVRNGDKVHGNIRVGGLLYQIRPLHDSRHVIALVNEALLPADHPADAYGKLFNAAEPFADAPDAPDAPNSEALTVIKVLVNYTQAVKDAYSDVPGLISLAIAEANRGYVNSDVSIKLELAHQAKVTYNQSGSFSRDLANYRGTTDRLMDHIHEQRDLTDADVAVLLIDDNDSCGLASAIGANATTAFAIAHYNCARTNLTFAHEIGHLQAARHDPANDSTDTPYRYGHGYQSPDDNWRTIMAYDCSGTSCPRLNFWSNPNKTYHREAMGTTAGNDNHRVLNNTRARVAGFR